MLKLVAIPALGCDAGLYAPLAAGLMGVAEIQTIIADRDRMDDCVGQVLGAVSGEFIVLGTSFGGRAALETALAARERVQGLIVIGASAGPSPDQGAGLRRSQRMRGGEFDAVIGEMANMVAHLPGANGPATREAFLRMANVQGAEIMARQSDALAWRGDLTPRLGEIKCPCLLIWGREDQFSNWRDGLKLSMALPRARYVEIPECGHFPTLEAPEETNRAIRHWLASSGLGDDKKA